MRRLWRGHPWLMTGFVLAVAVALLLGGLALRQGFDLHEDGPGPVKAWMTPRYLVHAYGISPTALAARLGKTPGESPRDTLAEIARARGMPVDDLIAAVEAERAALRGPKPSDD